MGRRKPIFLSNEFSCWTELYTTRTFTVHGVFKVPQHLRKNTYIIIVIIKHFNGANTRNKKTYFCETKTHNYMFPWLTMFVQWLWLAGRSDDCYSGDRFGGDVVPST